jgi:hypothetical protein
MKKFTVTIMVIAVVALALGAAGVAYAQGATQGTGTGFGPGGMGGRGSRGGIGAGNMSAGDGILHDYMISAFAEELNIPVADLEARLEQGETMAQIAVSTGLTVDQFRTLMIESRTQAIDQAVADGTLTQEQADWMKQRGVGQMGNGRGMHGAGQGQFANPDCPYYNQTNP